MSSSEIGPERKEEEKNQAKRKKGWAGGNPVPPNKNHWSCHASVVESPTESKNPSCFPTEKTLSPFFMLRMSRRSRQVFLLEKLSQRNKPGKKTYI
jgi:hypothetical protein